MASFTKSSYLVLAVVILFFIVALPAAEVRAGEKVELEGEIRGVKCTHFKVECKNDDNHIALETDFVLVMPDGTYYFMPNLTRGIKARHAYKKVHIRGELTRQEIWVYKLVDLDKKGSAKSKTSWDWSDDDDFWESK